MEPVSLLSDEELQISVATLLGWTEVMLSILIRGQCYGYQPGKGPPNYIKSRVPDYCHDLNAMHEAEPPSENGQPNPYWHHLAMICLSAELRTIEIAGSKVIAGGTDFCLPYWAKIARATARQRAEAFVLTMQASEADSVSDLTKSDSASEASSKSRPASAGIEAQTKAPNLPAQASSPAPASVAPQEEWRLIDGSVRDEHGNMIGWATEPNEIRLFKAFNFRLREKEKEIERLNHALEIERGWTVALTKDNGSLLDTEVSLSAQLTVVREALEKICRQSHSGYWEYDIATSALSSLSPKPVTGKALEDLP